MSCAHTLQPPPQQIIPSLKMKRRIEALEKTIIWPISSWYMGHTLWVSVYYKPIYHFVESHTAEASKSPLANGKSIGLMTVSRWEWENVAGWCSSAIWIEKKREAKRIWQKAYWCNSLLLFIFEFQNRKSKKWMRKKKHWLKKITTVIASGCCIPRGH